VMANNLFYRANERAPLLPFEVSITSETVEVTHARATDLVGPIVYLHDDGQVFASVTPPPAIGRHVSLSRPTGSVDAAKDAIDRAMAESGLTEEERDAFDRAWEASLYGRGVAKKSPKTQPALVDYILFVVPASLVDGVSTISISPAPKAIKRFILVRMAV
jgi:hypothetical protein